MRGISTFRFALAGVGLLFSVLTVQSFARVTPTDVSFTGLVTCSQCTQLTQRKGFTRWSWAMYRLSNGDRLVFVTSDKIYKLQGDREQLSKYVEDKATVTGHLDVDTIEVTNITRSTKEK